MAGKREKPKDIVLKLRQVEMLQGQGKTVLWVLTAVTGFRSSACSVFCTFQEAPWFLSFGR